MIAFFGGIPYTAQGAQIPPPPPRIFDFGYFLFLCLIQVRLGKG